MIPPTLYLIVRVIAKCSLKTFFNRFFYYEIRARPTTTTTTTTTSKMYLLVRVKKSNVHTLIYILHTYIHTHLYTYIIIYLLMQDGHYRNAPIVLLQWETESYTSDRQIQPFQHLVRTPGHPEERYGSDLSPRCSTFV